MDDQQKNQIKQYVKILNSKVQDGDLLDFTIDLAVDRLLLYLNDDKLSPKLNRVAAQVIVGVYTKASAEQSNTGAPEQSIKSISDNGQSITYSDQVKSYMVSAGDEELFSGFERLLKDYRRARVIAG